MTRQMESNSITKGQVCTFEEIPQIVNETVQSCISKLEGQGFTGSVQTISHSVTSVPRGLFLVTVLVMRLKA
jgi:hypothetical protein